MARVSDYPLLPSLLPGDDVFAARLSDGARGSYRFDLGAALLAATAALNAETTRAEDAEATILSDLAATGYDMVAGIAENQVAPEWFGALGNGTTNDAAALQAALNTGKNVILTAGKTYKFTSGLTLHSNEQRFGGAGILAPNGSFDAVTISGGLTGCELDLTFNAPSHTGTAVKINNASRVRIRKLLGIDVSSVLSIQKANVVTVDWLWAQARGKGITWFGNATNRSDILHIGFALIGFADGSTQYGFDWDGNCNSFSCGYLGIVNGYGAIIRNTSGDAPPAIGRFNHIEIDFSDTHGIDITAGSDLDFNLSYSQGCTGSGLRIASTINADEVRIGGGKFRGNTRYGIENLSAGQALVVGNVDLNSNSLGPTLGPVTSESVRFQVDTTSYWTLIGGNPVLAWDSNDYMTYDRTNNVLRFYVGATQVFALSASNSTIAAGAGAGTSPTIAITNTPSGGRITLTTGTTPTLNGVIATITYATAYATDSTVVISPANAAAAGVERFFYATGTTTGFTLTNTTSALVAATQYIWEFQVTGK